MGVSYTLALKTEINTIMNEVVKITKRDKRLEEEFHMKPVDPDQLAVADELPQLSIDIDTLEINDLEGDINCIYQMAKEAYDLSKTSAEKADDMLEDQAIASAMATSAGNLKTAIAAINQVAKLKLSLIKIKDGMDEEGEEGTIQIGRDELVQLLQEANKK